MTSDEVSACNLDFEVGRIGSLSGLIPRLDVLRLKYLRKKGEGYCVNIFAGLYFKSVNNAAFV